MCERPNAFPKKKSVQYQCNASIITTIETYLSEVNCPLQDSSSFLRLLTELDLERRKKKKTKILFAYQLKNVNCIDATIITAHRWLSWWSTRVPCGWSRVRLRSNTANGLTFKSSLIRTINRTLRLTIIPDNQHYGTLQKPHTVRK